MWLDLDELDSRTRKNIAEIAYSGRYYVETVKTLINGALYSFREMRNLPHFDKIFTFTREEKSEVLKKLRLKNVEVFENMLPVRFAPTIQPAYREPFRFLFVGNYSYFPNRDAMDVILFDIVPELKKIAKKPFRFVIIGGPAKTKSIKRFEDYTCVDFYDDVYDLEVVYSRINAVIVPLRAGGGSSLKFLEALRYRKPVVSSAVGARGFEISHGEHVLIGKDTSEIAKHCNLLMGDSELAEKLSGNGYQWFIENNSYKIEVGEEQTDLRYAM